MSAGKFYVDGVLIGELDAIKFEDLSSKPIIYDYQTAAIAALMQSEVCTVRTFAVDIEASPDAITFATQDAFDTIKRYSPTLAQGVQILGTQTLREFANDRRFTTLFIDEASSLTPVVDEPKTHDIRREAKRLRQAEAKLARQRQIRAKGGKR